jgi:hypothetical protein
MVSVIVFPSAPIDPELRVRGARTGKHPLTMRISGESLRNSGPKRQFIFQGPEETRTGRHGFLATPQ